MMEHKTEESSIMKPKGIAQRLDMPSTSMHGVIEVYPPDYTVTETVDKGGQVLTEVEVILCFWGRFWSQTPVPSPSSDEYKAAIEKIITGGYMRGLNQYRNVGPGKLIYSEINDSSDPVNGYTDADVVSMLKERLESTSMPRPTLFHNRFYAVILPPGIHNKLYFDPKIRAAGQHQSFEYNGTKGYYAWIDNSGSLTGHDCVTKIFSHELVEACTNPNVDNTLEDGILVNGFNTQGEKITNDEIGDTCNSQFKTVNMNGIICSVQSYWGKTENKCIIPMD